MRPYKRRIPAGTAGEEVRVSSPSFEQLSNVRLLGSARYSPDGRRFAYLASTSGRLQLWSQPDGGGFATQLTALPDRRVAGFEWSPDGRRIALMADRDGDEQYQLFLIEVGDDGRAGWPRRLTHRDDVQFFVSSWSPDGRIVFSAADREPTEVDPQIMDPETGEVERLMTGGLNYPGHVSKDGRWLTIERFYSNTNQDILLLDLETGEAELVTPHEGHAMFRPLAWVPDGSGFNLLTDADREFTGHAFFSLETRSWNYVRAPEHDVEGVHHGLNSSLVATVENEAGASRVGFFDMATRELPAPPELPVGVIRSLDLHPTERRALLTFATPREPANIFELDVDTGVLQRREQSMLGGVDPAILIEPELIAYPSFDRDIPAWLYRPRGGGPFPVVLSIHGGPEAQERPEDYYTGLYQYLLTRGVAVLAPNIRGSTGYGRTYQRLIQRDWGGGDLKDIDAAAKWLREQPWADPARLGIFGGSFGGFAVLSALARLPEHWAVGAEAVGPSNLMEFARSVPPHWRTTMKDFVGDPDEDAEMLLERSPITYVDGIRAPLLVYQGANDPRVVKAESDRMVEALRARGHDVKYVVDEKSGHGPADNESAVRWWGDFARYLEKQLVG